MHALQRLYATRTGFVFLECVTRPEWEALCRILEHDALPGDARFASAEARRRIPTASTSEKPAADRPGRDA